MMLISRLNPNKFFMYSKMLWFTKAPKKNGPVKKKNNGVPSKAARAHTALNKAYRNLNTFRRSFHNILTNPNHANHRRANMAEDDLLRDLHNKQRNWNRASL